MHFKRLEYIYNIKPFQTISSVSISFTIIFIGFIDQIGRAVVLKIRTKKK